MSVTAKEIAEKLGLSQTAVSMALRGKAGVSTKTRQRVIREAEKSGYDFERIRKEGNQDGTIYIIQYIVNNAIMGYTPIFTELTEGVRNAAAQNSLRIRLMQIREKSDDLDRALEDLRVTDCIGIILLGTEISKEICRKFMSIHVPVVLLDTYFPDLDCDSVLINNEAGAFMAAEHLIRHTGKRPGYIASSYRIPNFAERESGYRRALVENGLSVSGLTRHQVSPSFEGAEADMIDIIEEGTDLAGAYFCENDIIAIGAIKALRKKNIRVPEDVSIIGFDNIPESAIIDPGLTTMDVPRHFMAECAARQLLFRIGNHASHPVKIAVAPELVRRESVR